MQRIIAVLTFLSFICLENLHAQKDLTYYIQQAKINSPLIQQYKNQMESSRLEVERLKSAYSKPQVSLIGNLLVSPIITRDKWASQVDWNPFIADKYSGYDLAASNGGAYVGLINVNQPLFNGTHYKAMSNQALLDIKINENNTQLTFHELEKTVTDQYIQCLIGYRQLENSSDMLDLINRQQSVISNLIEKGIARQSDLSLLIIDQRAEEASLEFSQSNYRKSLLNLRMLCGIPDTTYQVVEAPNLTLNPDVDNFHFTETYRLDSMSLMANQRIFELKYKPWTTLFANTGLNAVYVPTISDRFGLSAGINFGMTLFDGKQRSITQQKTNALLKSTRVSETFFINQNVVRKNSIKNDLKSMTKRLALVEQELIEYQNLLILYQDELSKGQVSVINYLSGLKNMTAANRDYTMLLAERELLISSYNYWNW